MRIETDKIYCGDSLQVLQTLPDNCMDCCVTSPPYYALRDYGTDGQIGREATPEEYVSRITAVFHEVKRVLTPEGTCWLNIADTYCGTGSKADHQDPKYPKGRNGQQVAVNHRAPGCKPKDLIGIPWLVALALRGDGWYLRSSIIWHKGNAMPESTRDRPTRCYEYVFLLILIAMQGGNLVKGYSQWQKEFDRHVKKGEKGIKIFAPAPYKVKKLVDKIDPETRKPMLDREGKVVKEEKEITVPAFKVITVFDISQTEGKEFPDLSVKPLLADVEQYEDFFAALEKASPVPIAFEQITNGANGYFSLTDKRIAIKEGVSELQAVKTAIHEIAHAKLHDVDLNAPPEQQNRVDRHTCEVEAESVAYTVCQHFGLDTSDYSFGYVAGWSSGKEMTELKASLETIQTTAKELITEIEGHFTELQQQRQAEQEQGDTFSIYQLKRGDETRDLRFEPYDRLQAAGLTIDRVNYELVYTAPLTKDMTLGDIWERFNIDHPADFKGHSLSVSDIVVLHQNDEDTAHYVDSIGFQQVPEFLQEQQTPVFDKLPPEQQQALSDTVQDTLQMLVDADKRIYGDVTGKTLEAIAAQGYSYKDGQLEKQQPEATPDSLLTGETVRTPRGNFHITDMSREQIEAAGFGFHHASEDGKYLIMGNGTQAYAIAAEQPQRDNPLKHVEDTIEQNDNNFDGLINNTPQTPTVADFEQRAKAGEAISVTDLAKAVKAEKREQPQKKPSILKKLDEYKKQAAQQPKDKQKEHKKDLEV